jgi:hypothetical protein
MTHEGIVVFATLQDAERNGFERIDDYDPYRRIGYWKVSCATPRGRAIALVSGSRQETLTTLR